MRKDKIDGYPKDVKKVLNRLQGIDFEVSQELTILLVFNSLLKQYNALVNTFIDIKTLPTFEKMESKLFNEEFHIK